MSAAFSPCRLYRYALWREWEAAKPRVMFVGLNPSTADEAHNDPTVRRCVAFARAWGYGGLVMLNLFAYRSTDPGTLRRVFDAVGPENDEWIAREAVKANLVVAAWGTRGSSCGRDAVVLELLPWDVRCLGRTKAGAPRHPLSLRKDCTPELLSVRGAA